MTERASELLSELADRLSGDAEESGLVAAESVRALAPEILKSQKGGSVDELVRTSVRFLALLFRSLRDDSRIPWPEYYGIACESSRRYAEMGIPLEALMEGLAVFRRSVVARVGEEVAGSPVAEEVLRLTQGRVGDVIEHLNSNFILGYLDYTEARHRARQSELHGLYHIASALGRSLDVSEIAEVGLRETLQVLRLQAGAVWGGEGARPKLAKTLGMQPGREEEHTREARTDYLTGLANRPEFERAIDRAVAAAQRHKRRLALMMIDLDNLEAINDTQGHHVGDEAIRVLAQELQRAVRATDTCGRLGGDEFGVAMPDADERHASDVATRVRQSLEELNRTGRSPVPVQFSIGITSWKTGMDWQAMYQVADKALYIDKRRRHAGRKAVGDVGS